MITAEPTFAKDGEYLLGVSLRLRVFARESIGSKEGGFTPRHKVAKDRKVI
jgi:hypothetical protein